MHDRHQIGAIEDAGQEQDTHPEQGGDRHVDQIEHDQEDDSGEDADGEIDLQIAHRSLTQSTGGA